MTTASVPTPPLPQSGSQCDLDLGLELGKVTEDTLTSSACNFIFVVKSFATVLLFVSYSFGLFAHYASYHKFSVCFEELTSSCEILRGVRLNEEIYLGMATFSFVFAIVSLVIAGFGRKFRIFDAILLLVIAMVNFVSLLVLMEATVELHLEKFSSVEPGVKIWARMVAIVMGAIAGFVHLIVASMLTCNNGLCSGMEEHMIILTTNDAPQPQPE